jgi:DNA-directed RNA polymerase subunit RPC12/RpoP
VSICLAEYKFIYSGGWLSVNVLRRRGSRGGGEGEMVKVKCHRCGYMWEYKGKLGMATCPNCGSKVNIRKNCVTEVPPKK